MIFMTLFVDAINQTTPEGSSLPCRVRILHVGGTLEKVEKRYKQLTEAWLETISAKNAQPITEGAAAAM